MATERNRQRRVSYAQLEALWEALTRNRSLATGFNKTAQARDAHKRMWNTIAEDLNSFGDGAIKDGKAWSKYWNDYKSKLKSRVAVLRVSRQRTGGGQAVEKDLTKIEEKFLQILGKGFSAGLPGVRVEPFEVPTDVNSQAVVFSQNLNVEAVYGHSESVLLEYIPMQQDDRILTPQPGPSRRFHETPAITPQHTPRRSPRHPQSTPHHTAPHTPRRSPRHPQHTPHHTPPHTPRRSPRHPQRTPHHTAPQTPRRSPRRPQRTPPHTQGRGNGPRRRMRTNPPMTMEMARRNLVASSQLKNEIAERTAKTLEELIREFKEFKNQLLSRLPLPPTNAQ